MTLNHRSPKRTSSSMSSFANTWSSTNTSTACRCSCKVCDRVLAGDVFRWMTLPCGWCCSAETGQPDSLDRRYVTQQLRVAENQQSRSVCVGALLFHVLQSLLRFHFAPSPHYCCCARMIRDVGFPQAVALQRCFVTEKWLAIGGSACTGNEWKQKTV